MVSIEDIIMIAMGELGYEDCETHVCVGLAQMWVQAYLCNEDQTFFDRIKLICQPDFVKKVNILLTKIANLNAQAILISNKQETELEKNLLTTDEKILRNALVFLDDVHSYSKSHLLKEYFGKHYAQSDVIPLSTFLNSIELENQGGLCIPFTETLGFDESELNNYFINLRNLLKAEKNSEWGKYAFTFGSGDHQFGLTYNVTTDKWRICNFSLIPFSNNPWLTYITTPISKLMLNALAEITPDKIGYFIRLSCGEKSQTIATIKMFTTNNNPQNERINATLSEFKKNHVIKKEIINKVDSKNKTLAFLAVQDRELELLCELIKHGLNVNHTCKIKNETITLLDIAIINGFDEIIKFLLDNGATVTSLKSPRLLLLKHSLSVSILELLSNSGVNLNLLDNEGYNIAHYAALNNSTKVIEYLANKKFNLNQPAFNHFDYTPSHSAALNGSVEMLETLAKCGAELNLPNRYGERPIHTACRKGNIQFIRALIQRAVNPNQTDLNGNNATHYAVQANINFSVFSDMPVERAIRNKVNANSIIDFLSEIKVDLNSPNNSGLRPVHLAIQTGNTDAVIALLQHGIDIDQTFPNGKEAISVAIEKKYWDLTMLYLLRPVALDTKDIKTLNQHRDYIVEAFINYVKKQDPVETNKLVLDVVNSKNALGKILNAFVKTLGFSYSSYQHDGKQITHSIAKIIAEFPIDGNVAHFPKQPKL